MMVGQLRFDGKVVIVTGAGAGLGRAYALLFGERGAKVVVNDLGGDIKGGGKSSRAADKVVEEIKAKGGIAVANYDTVENGEAVVKTALDNFGKIDILINNAGILRDRSLARTSDFDWDLVHRVHLRGSFMVTRAAWSHMKDNKYGKIIMTSSSAGIYGNFGQSNYSAAKLGLLGLSNTVAIEGAKYNIMCNTVAPLAGTRLLATVTPEEVQAVLKPELVAPYVIWLCHEDCEETRGLFEIGGGWASKLRWQRTQGKMLRENVSELVSPEKVRDNWEDITDFENEATFPTVGGETTGIVLNTIREMDEKKRIVPNKTSTSLDPNVAIGQECPEGSVTYDDTDVMLYALGVGVSTRQKDHLKFIYELSEDFCVLPTFIIQSSMSGAALLGMPGIDVDPTMILHGEQYLEVYKPLATSGTIRSKGRIADIIDKGRGALIITDVDSYNERNEKIAFTQTVVYIQRAGGFGGKRTSDKQVMAVDPPKRAPDASVTETTDVDQAALYRLHGDRNPLHLDPNFAAMGGFETPILHGLCSFGYAVRHVLQQYAGNDVSKFKSAKVRFSRTVLPSQSIQTDMWQEGNRIHFQSKVVETGEVCLSGAYVDLHGVSSTSSSVSSTQVSGLQSEAAFSEITKRVAANKDLAQKMKAVICFDITKDGKVAKSWTANLKGANEVYEGRPKTGKADLTITMADGDFVDLVSGKLNGQKAFMSGKLKAKGNIMLAQKMGSLFEDKSKL